LACYYSIPIDNTTKSLHPAQINATLCTHLIVAFAQVQNNSVYFKSSFDMEVRYSISLGVIMSINSELLLFGLINNLMNKHFFQYIQIYILL